MLYLYLFLQLSIVSDYLNDSFHEEKLFEGELIKESMYEYLNVTGFSKTHTQSTENNLYNFGYTELPQ